MTYIGCDNGISGSIGIITGRDSFFYPVPIVSGQDYTKAKKTISRIDNRAMRNALWQHPVSKVFIERPMVNPGRFAATGSALRALESVLIAVEYCNLPYEFVDSRAWQKALLPSGIKGAPELKKASLDIGIRLFPHLEKEIRAQGDADGLLIALWAQRAGR